jgi:hypothetical protein
MSNIHLPYDENPNINFVHIVNYLVSHSIMSLDEAIIIYKEFKSNHDAVLNIPDLLVNDFKKELASLGCTYY